MDVTKPYEFVRFGAIDVTKPYKSIGFGDIQLGVMRAVLPCASGAGAWADVGTTPTMGGPKTNSNVPR